MEKHAMTRNGMLGKTFSGVLAAAMICGCMTPAAFAADGSKEANLSYQVAEGLGFDDTSVFADSDAAWAYADKIVDHVEGTVEDMREIFAQRTVKITDEAYGAEPHAVFPLVEGTYKKSAEDAEAERVLAEKNTRAIYKAIKEVSELGGGTVVIPAVEGEVFYSAAIHLEDNVNLHFEDGAELWFTTDYESYAGDLMEELYGSALTLTRFESVELMNYSPFLYAYGKENIGITGKGTINGQASTGDKSHPETMTWHQWKSSRTYTLPEGGTKKIEAQDKPRTKLFGQGQIDVPVAERVYGHSTSADYSGADDGFLRPNFVQPYNCQNVLIEGIRVEGSPMWELNPVLCDTVMVQDVYVESHMHNNDGCDPEASSNVVIQDSYFDVGDDCIAIKSGRNGDGLRIDRASYNLVIQDNTFVDGHGGVTIGSEITGGVKNIFSRNNEMDSDMLQAAYRFKTNYIRGGIIENIYYKNDTVKMVESGKPVILVDLNYDISKEVTMMKAMNVEYQAYIPAFKHVLFEGMKVNEAGKKGNGGRYAMQLNGFNVSGIDPSCTVPEGTKDCYISDFTIKDSTFVGSQQAFAMTNVDGLTLDNVTITGTTSKDSVKNCKNLTFTNCNFTNSAIVKSIFDSVENMDLTGTLFDGVNVALNTADSAYFGEPAEFVLSLGNAEKVNALEIDFDVDGSMLSLDNIAGLEGFFQIGDVIWSENTDGTSHGKLTVGKPGGDGFTITEMTDILKIYFANKGVTGETAVTLTGVKASTLAGGMPQWADCVLTQESAVTSIKGIRYDLNGDGKVDMLDVATALVYYQMSAADAGWAEAAFCDVTGDGVIDMADLTLVMANYTV